MKNILCKLGLHNNKIVKKDILGEYIHVEYKCKNCGKLSCDITWRK